jgi:hypothetical protein
VQRDADFLPALDQRPVHGAEKKMLAATANKRVFDFGKVIEVVQE